MSQNDPMITMSALNMAVVSIYRITSSGDRTVLDREYDGIINNLNMNAINADDNLIRLYQQIVSAIHKGKLADTKRAELERQSSEQKHKSIGDIISGKILGTFKMNPLEWLGDLAMSSASEYFRSRIQPGKNDALFSIQKEELDGYNELTNQLFNVSAKLIGMHNLPNSSRVTNRKLVLLSKAINQPVPSVRWRMLRDLEGAFSVYSPYWFYRAKAAQEMGNDAEAEKCFIHFGEVWRPVLMQDPYKVEALKYRVGVLMRGDSTDDNRDEILRCLAEIKEYTPFEDWANYIFIGMVYFSLGCRDEAVDCVMHNIDFDYETDLSNKILARIESTKNDDPRIGNGDDTKDGTKLPGKTETPVALPPATVTVSSTVSNTAQPAESKSILDRIRTMISRKRLASPAVTPSKPATITPKPASQPPVIEDEEPVFVGISSRDDTAEQVPETKPVRRDRIWQLADKGDPRMQFVLALNFYSGRGVSQDYAEAVRWFRKAAEKGHAEAQVRLGDAYYKGEGIEQDKAKAVKWYRKAAEQGHAQAQNYVGFACSRGEGVKQDKVEAVKWYRKAAEQGHVKAQFSLALVYDNGDGVKQDKVEAAKWYRKAAEQKHVKAQFSLALMYNNGEGVKQDKVEAAKWYRKAALQGHASAQYNLALMYYNGEGVKQDKVEAAKWYGKAAEQGHARAQFNLGVMYEFGNGVKQDKAEAVKLYRKAAEQGHARAQFNLAVSYDEGDGVKQDKAEAIKWYRKAAEQGYAPAQYNLGLMYEFGDGVRQDKVKAVKWYREAARNGDTNAQKKLSELHETW